jgi:predicted ATP-binding protein involved in virulence
MIKIRSLHLENYRGFIDTTIEFGDHITCIAGINGAGKSSVLCALSRVLESLYTSFPKEPFIKSTDINKNAKTKIAKAVLSFLVNKKITTQQLSSNDVLILENEIFSKYIKSHDVVISYYSVNRSELDVDVSVDQEKDLSNKKEAMTNAFNSVTHYKEFFQWFRDREDRENAIKLEKYENGDTKTIFEDIELKAVRNAISVLTPDFSKMKIDKNRQSVLITKGNTSIDFSTLSDGEKGVITLFGDIARRLAIANETLENPLEGNGIILIDEIDLHLHPSWQRKICHALVKTFPNCQFVITTHSPQILGELKTDEIWLLNDFNVYRPDSSFGLTSNQILDEVMDVIDGDFSLSRDSTIAKKLQALNLAMETEKFAEAKKIIAEIEETTGTNLHEAESCKIALEMMESEE